MNWRYEREGLSIFSHSFYYNDICFRKVRGSGLRLCGFSLTLNKISKNYPVIFAWTSKFLNSGQKGKKILSFTFIKLYSSEQQKNISYIIF